MIILYQDMNNKTYTQILLSAVITAALFFSGFFAGQNSIKEDPIRILNATSTEEVDMAPFWKAWQTLNKRFVPAGTTTPEVTSKEKIWGSIQGLASSYGDPYTVFFPPEESKAFEEEISGSFGGVGMEIDIINNTLTVVAPLKGTPAEKADIRAGDKIIMIGDKSAAGMSTTEAVKFIKGNPGTPVTITFSREGAPEPLVKTLVRDIIEIPIVDTKKLPDGIFVIELYSFSANSPNLFRSALREFVESGSNKLILDLRNNPGGYLEAAIDMASWFLPRGKVITTEDFGGKQEAKAYRSRGYDVFNENLKFAILINEGSASASEILAGALSEYDKATLIGGQTFGKGSVQELVPITSDTSLKITVAHWFTPNGKSISVGGLTPDIEVEVTPENTKDDADPILKKAIEFLNK